MEKIKCQKRIMMRRDGTGNAECHLNPQVLGLLGLLGSCLGDATLTRFVGPHTYALAGGWHLQHPTLLLACVHMYIQSCQVTRIVDITLLPFY